MSQIVTQNQTKCQYQSEKSTRWNDIPVYGEHNVDYVD